MSEQAGDLGAEAARLLSAAEKWWHDARTSSSTGDDAPPAAHLGPECTVCPVCQLLAMLRTARPELFEHLSAAATSLISAARSTFESSSTGWAPRPDGPTVERIDIR